MPDGGEALEHYLAGAAANLIQSNGTLRIANVPTPTTRPQISENRAREIATAFIATHLRGLRSSLEKDRGASIDVASLTVCPRVFYAETAFEELPDEVPGMYHRWYGPWWLTSLCTSGGEPVVALGISAYATELGISGGKLTYSTASSGGEFRWLGIRPGDDEYLLPIPPEAAVRRAAGLAHRRIAAIPRLILPRPGSGFPQLAQWQLTLDGEADVKVSQASNGARVTELFVGAQALSRPKTRMAVPEQPDVIDVEWWPSPAIGQSTPPPSRMTRVARRTGIPVTFQEVERGGGQ